MSPVEKTFPEVPSSEAKRVRVWVRVLIVVSTLSALASAWVGIYKRFNPELPYKTAQRLADDPMSVTRHVRINGVDLWIPVPYFMSGHTPAVVPQKDVLLVVTYPEYEPLRKTEHELWLEDEWIAQHIRWLIQDASKMISREQKAAVAMSATKATVFHGMQYGLKFYSRPDGVKSGRPELWFEGSESKPDSLIMCSVILTPRSHPQCDLNVWADGFWYHISFDKTLLPDWRHIKTRILTISRSFLRNTSQSSTSSNNGE